MKRTKGSECESVSSTENTSVEGTISLDSPSKEIDINFSMGKFIGKGSFGTVNICTDLNTGHFYAVKHVSFDSRFLTHHAKKVKKKFY